MNKTNDLFDNKTGLVDKVENNYKYKLLKVGYGKKNPNINRFKRKKK